MRPVKRGDTLKYAVKTASGLKIKYGTVDKVSGGKIYLDTTAVLWTSDQIKDTDTFRDHHDFQIFEGKKMKLKPLLEDTRSVLLEEYKLTEEQLRLDSINEECEKIIKNINIKLASYRRKKDTFIDNNYDFNIKFWTRCRAEMIKLNTDSRKIFMKIKDYEEKRLNER